MMRVLHIVVLLSGLICLTKGAEKEGGTQDVLKTTKKIQTEVLSSLKEFHALEKSFKEEIGDLKTVVEAAKNAKRPNKRGGETPEMKAKREKKRKEREEMKKLKDQIQVLRQERKKVKQEKPPNTEKLANLNAEIKKMMALVQKDKMAKSAAGAAQKVAAADKLAKPATGAAKKASEMKKLRDQIQVLRQERKKAKAEKPPNKEKLANLNAEIKKIRALLQKDKKAKSAAGAAQTAAEMKNLQNQLQGLRKERKKLKKEKPQDKEKIANLTAEIKKIKALVQKAKKRPGQKAAGKAVKAAAVGKVTTTVAPIADEGKAKITAKGLGNLMKVPKIRAKRSVEGAAKSRVKRGLFGGWMKKKKGKSGRDDDDEDEDDEDGEEEDKGTESKDGKDDEEEDDDEEEEKKGSKGKHGGWGRRFKKKGEGRKSLKDKKKAWIEKMSKKHHERCGKNKDDKKDGEDGEDKDNDDNEEEEEEEGGKKRGGWLGMMKRGRRGKKRGCMTREDWMKKRKERREKRKEKMQKKRKEMKKKAQEGLSKVKEAFAKIPQAFTNLFNKKGGGDADYEEDYEYDENES